MNGMFANVNHVKNIEQILIFLFLCYDRRQYKSLQVEVLFVGLILGNDELKNKNLKGKLRIDQTSLSRIQLI
jgi:hypothetical protein